MEANNMENNTDYDMTYKPYITDYPYLGWNNVLGGGGRDPGADLYVPPQRNLYGAGLSDIKYWQIFGFNVLTLAIGFILGVYAWPVVKEKLNIGKD
jgi:hypothetical protein